MNPETKTCQNCKNQFTIESDDFSFYEKMQVPAPTFCPQCRLQRRMMFRNERVLYKRNCDLCHESAISVLSTDKPYKVYCSKCWWGEGWDCGDYYLDYDPNINFFEQIKELQKRTPCMDKVVSYTKLVNSDYINHASTCKNCYLIFDADDCENVYYSTTAVNLKDCSDCLMMLNSELSYGCIGGNGSGLYFSDNCIECIDMWYSKACLGCHDCFGCVNLQKKSYHIFNEPYTKEEYHKKIKEMNLDTYEAHSEIQKTIYSFWEKFPRKYMYSRMNVNSTGNYMRNCKNAKECYQAVHVEDSAYCQFITMAPFRDCYDISEWGHGAEMCIEAVTTGEGVSHVKYCYAIWNNCQNIEYSMFLINCKNCFGCMNLRNKEYCILNKQYTEEEYEVLREQIIQGMTENPYVDGMGRVFYYGEFFPYDLSIFAYNESYAPQYFPLDKTQIESKGFKYLEPKRPDYKQTIELGDIPNSIHDVPDDFIKEVLNCKCGKFYKIVVGELQLLKRFGIPVPRSCSDCRHMSRLNRMNMPKLYDRNCDSCGVAFKTGFSPSRPEKILCESCYQKEVM